MAIEIKVVLQDNGELVELTGESAELYLQDISEQVESLNQIKAEIEGKALLRQSALNKLAALGLTQEEIEAL
jgi:hypothetical protein